MTIANLASGRALLGASLGLLALAGCHKKPEGQVVATVNGEEITRRDLVTEFAASGGQSPDDLKGIQPALVQSIVNRKLLVQEAKRENLDKNPQFLAYQQRGQETLLAQMLAQTWLGKVKPASAAEAQAFIAENPLMFGGRKMLLVDEIVTASTGIGPADLAQLHGNDAVAAWLKAHNRPFRRGNNSFDTLRLPKALAEQLLARVGGEPIALPAGSAVAITAVKEAKDAPVPEADRLKVAQAAVGRRNAEQITGAQMKQLRDTADVSYLPGFAPPNAKH